MAEAIQVDAEHFLNLLDPDVPDSDTFYGSTLFRYFRYKNKPCLQDEEPWFAFCRHADRARLMR